MQEDEEPEARAPHYLTTPHVEAPPGYVAVANFDLPSGERPAVLVPESVAMQLAADRRQANARLVAKAGSSSASNARITRDSNDKVKVAAPAPSTGSSSSTWAAKRRIEHAVDTTVFSTGWPKPRGRGWVRVWQPETMLAAVQAHNQGFGSSDLGDVAREAATLRRVLALGPWRRCAAPRDGEAVVRQLEGEFGHLPELVRLVAERMALSHESRQPFSLPPLLLVGPPGVGKSHIALCLAEVLGLPARCVDMGTQQTNGFLHGSDRHWSNARPGLLSELLLTGSDIAGAASVANSVANPVVVLDELDKCSRVASRHDPVAALYLALEPSTARRSRDQCSNLEFDAGWVIYVATANSLADLPTPLLSRFRLLLVGPPQPRHAMAAAARIAERLLAEAGLTRRFAPIGRSLLARLADRNPREMGQLLSAALARAVAAGRLRMELRDIDPDDPTDAAMRLH